MPYGIEKYGRLNRRSAVYVGRSSYLCFGQTGDAYEDNVGWKFSPHGGFCPRVDIPEVSGYEIAVLEQELYFGPPDVTGNYYE
jgi:hypothetical protein